MNAADHTALYIQNVGEGLLQFVINMKYHFPNLRFSDCHHLP